MIVTFYSYKGGVGRSMAMANVADILAHRGARVLMIDFDLEAPGLEQYFEVPQDSARAHPGLMDLLTAFKQALAVGGGRADFRDVERYILPIYPQPLPGGGTLDLMPAGKREGADLDAYATAVRSFDWQDFYFNWEGELFFEWLREQLTKDRYDLVLVDSRTGVTEMGGICSYQLADQVVMLCAANRQNVRGTRNVAEDFLSTPVMSRRKHRGLDLLVVPARIEQRDPALLEEFLTRFESTFSDVVPARLTERGVSVRGLMIPYQPEFAFEERVITDPSRGAQRADIGGAFLELARAIVLLAPEGSAIAKLAATMDQGPATVAYDVTTRFGGYDVHLAGNAEARGELEAVRRVLEDLGCQVFLDPLELVPPEEWRRRSEQVLFHSRLLLVVGESFSTAQEQALAGLLRANRNARSRNARLVAFHASGAPPVAEALGLECVPVRGGPDDEDARATLARLISSTVAKGGEAAPGSSREAAAPAPPARSAASAAPAPSAVTAAPTIASGQPFQGPAPFREDGAAYFFGRERLVADLVAAIEAHPRVWLLGPSGSGKTSAVLAGVFPILRTRMPGRSLERLEVGTGLLDQLSATVARMPRGADRHVLFIDEVERLVTHPQGAAIRNAIAGLATARPDVVVLLGVREDATKQFIGPPLALVSNAGSTVWVPDFTTGELRAAIERPAEKGGLAYEPGLVDRILADAGLQASALRLVQQSLLRLWENRRDGWLTNAAYERTGGIAAVVAEIGESALATYTGSAAELDRLLPRLVTIDPEGAPEAARPEKGRGASAGPALRRRLNVRRDELRPAVGDDTACDEAIAQLVHTGLLVARANDAEEPCVELVHDFALTQVPRLAARLATLLEDPDTRAFLSWRQRLGEGIARKAELKGKELRDARRWLARRPADLNAEERTAINGAVRDQRFVYAGFAIMAVVVGVIWMRQARADRVTHAINAVTAAEELVSRGEYASAIDSLNAALDRYPARDTVLLKRGRAYAAAGNEARALADYGAALAINPGLNDARRGQAEVHVASGRYAEAVADYDEILRRDSTDADAWFNRAAARDRMKGNTDSTLADFTRAYAADTTRIDALFERGKLLQRLEQRDEAIKVFTMFLARATNPNDQAAAQARLAELRATASAGTPPAQTSASPLVYLHYADPADSASVGRVGTIVKAMGAFRVPEPELQRAGRGGIAELRHVAGDERLAADAQAAVEAALAKAGYRIRLTTRVLDPNRFPGARSGRVEVWLPSLSRSNAMVQMRY